MSIVERWEGRDRVKFAEIFGSRELTHNNDPFGDKKSPYLVQFPKIIRKKLDKKPKT
jgi:hypothetical protein